MNVLSKLQGFPSRDLERLKQCVPIIMVHPVEVFERTFLDVFTKNGNKNSLVLRLINNKANSKIHSKNSSDSIVIKFRSAKNV